MSNWEPLLTDFLAGATLLLFLGGAADVVHIGFFILVCLPRLLKYREVEDGIIGRIKNWLKAS